MQILYILRTIAMYVYMFGYMLLRYGTLRRAEKAKAAGDLETVRQIINYQIPRWCRGLLKVSGVRMTVEGVQNIPASGPVVFVGNHRSYGQGRAGQHPPAEPVDEPAGLRLRQAG